MGTVINYTIYSSRERKEFFFSTSHLQRFDSPIKIDDSFVPISGRIPTTVIPRPSLPDGYIDTMEKYIMIFHGDEKEIPNPDSKFQAKF